MFIIRYIALIVALVITSGDVVLAQTVYGPGGVKVAKPSGSTGSSYQTGGPAFNLAPPSSLDSESAGAPKISGKSTTSNVVGAIMDYTCIKGNVGSVRGRLGNRCTGLGKGHSFNGGGFSNEVIDGTTCAVVGIPQGSFGAMAMILAGLIAVCGAMLGSYRMALNTILVGGGAWAILPMITLFWGDLC
jgi:hypothetical protein